MKRYVRNVHLALQERFSVIGGPAAVSNPVLICLAVGSFIGTFTNHVWRLGQPPGETLVRSILSAALGCAILGIFRLTVLPVRPRPSRTALAFMAYALACFSVVVFLNALFDDPASVSRDLYESTALPTLIGTTTLAVTAFIVGTRAITDALTVELERRNEELIALRDGYEVDLDQARELLATQVQGTLEDRLADIREAMSNLHPEDRMEIEHAGSMLVDAVRDVVRPLSHELMATPKPQEAPTSEPEHLDRQVSSPRTFDVAAALQPGWATLTYGLFSFTSAQVSSGDPVGSTWRTLFAILVFPLLIAIQRWWPKRWSVMRALPAFVLLITMYLVVLTFVRWAYQLVQESQIFNLPPLYSTSARFVGVATIISVALALTGLVRVHRDALRAKLQMINNAILIQNTRLRREIWHSRANLSRYLHGPVQSALISASIALTNRGLDQQRINELRDMIDASTRNLQNLEVSGLSLRDALVENKNLWQDSCEITWNVSDQIASDIETSPTLTKAIAETIREAISNAIRHGSATTVLVEIACSIDAHLTVTVFDNGNGVSANEQPGLGSALLDQVCLTWHRTSSPQGTTLTATLPR